MISRQHAAMSDVLALVAPGRPLRDGLDRILRAKRGGLVVIGDGPDVLSICSGGFLLDSEFSPQRLSELAKMDGATILAPDASRIARANVHLMPDASIPTTETGTRHRTAERVARSIDVPVLSVSAAMSVIAVYRNDQKHTLQPTGWLHDRTDQALATMQRFRNRFDVALNNLSMLEVEDTVSVGDVVAVVQAAEMVLRIAEEVDGYLVELGDDGRLVGLQSAELVDGVARALHLVVRDYWAHADPVNEADGLTTVDAIIEQLAHLPSDELRDPERVMKILRLPGHSHDSDVGGRAAGIPAALPSAAVLGHHHRADRRPVRQPPADHAGIVVGARAGGGRRPGPGALGQGRPQPIGRGQYLRALPVAGASPRAPGAGSGPAACTMECFPFAAPLTKLCPGSAPVTPGGTVFDIGDKVVYPHHGAAVVEKRETKEAFGKKQEYLVLKLAYGDLTLMVPADNTDGVGLREVINDEEVEEVFAVLRKKEARMPTNWSRRYKNHSEKLRSGDIYQVAEVVRNLSIRDKDKGLSAGEKRMLSRARQILVSELTFALGVDEETAELRLNEALP